MASTPRSLSDAKPAAQRATPAIVLWTLIAVYAVAFSWMALARHAGLKTQLVDLGNMDQAIHQTLHGNFMAYTSNGDHSVRIGGHANWILLAFVPLYAVGAGPWLLLVVQCFGVALAAWPIARFASRKLGNHWAGVAAAGLFLLNPMVHDATLYDFHPEVFAMVFIAAAFDALDERRIRRFALFVGILLLVKEDFPLLVVMLGLYALVVQRRWRLGIGTAAVGLVVFVLNLWVFMPAFSLTTETVGVVSRYGAFGSNPSEIAMTILTHPGTVLATIGTLPRIEYLVFLLMPFAFIPLVGLPVAAIALPNMAINLLASGFGTVRPNGTYYSASILVILTLATVSGIATLKRRWPRSAILPISFSFTLIATIVFSLTVSPAPYSQVSSVQHFTVSEHAKRLSRITDHIPADASVSAQNNLGAHLAQRAHIYTFPLRMDEAEYVFVDAWDPNADYSIYTMWYFNVTAGSPLETYASHVQQVFDNPDYGLVARDGTYLLFRRGASRAQNADAYTFFTERIVAMHTEFIHRYGSYANKTIKPRDQW